MIGLTGRPGVALDAIPNMDGARLVAFAFADGERLAKKGAGTRRQRSESTLNYLSTFPKETNVYGTYQEMLAKENLDIVAVCLPNGLNVHASMAAARKGCHVISEEPLALGARSLTALESVVNETRVQITAMCEMRLSSGVASMRQAIADGLIGEPILAFAQKSYSANNDQSSFSTQPRLLWIPLPGLEQSCWIAFAIRLAWT